MTEQSQAEMILRALQRGLVVSPIYALREFGCLRLAARIHELRARGNAILSTDHPDGYAMYFMAPEQVVSDPVPGFDRVAP